MFRSIDFELYSYIEYFHIKIILIILFMFDKYYFFLYNNVGIVKCNSDFKIEYIQNCSCPMFKQTYLGHDIFLGEMLRCAVFISLNMVV